MTDTWTIRAALAWTEGYLERKGDENPRLSAQWLITEALNTTRIALYTDLDRPLTMDERDVLRSYVSRRGAGEPLQYITGEVTFRYASIKVAQGVLIPRPETEVLVSEALALLPPLPKRIAFDSRPDAWEGQGETVQGEAASGDGSTDSLRDDTDERTHNCEAPCNCEAPRQEVLIADLCTGSGCIACSLATEYPSACIIATDIEPRAVALAKENAQTLGVDDRVSIIECDLATGIPPQLSASFDLVVANPPYIPTAELAELSEEVVGYEPVCALDGGKDGLLFFRRILTWAKGALKPHGGLAVELHETCLDEAKALASDAGFVDVESIDDLAARPRVLIARAPDKRN